MRAAGLLLLLSLVQVERAEACEAITCDDVPVKLELAGPRPDAGAVPTNVNVLVAADFEVASSEFLWLGRADGGDGAEGLGFELSSLDSFPCTQLLRLNPREELLPGTDYELRFKRFPSTSREVDTRSRFFQTGTGPDVNAPSFPSVQSRQTYGADCSSCGPSAGAHSLTFAEGDFVWVAPIEARFHSSGGSSGFSVPFACAPGDTGLPEGNHRMPVVAFDNAWNQSEVAYIDVESVCTGIDPCTGERTNTEAARLPLGGGGCGCNEAPGALSLLSAAALWRVLRRKRAWWNSSTSGCSRWGLTASSSSRSRR